MFAGPPHSATVLVERAEIDAIWTRPQYENLGCHEHVEARPSEVFRAKRIIGLLFLLLQTALVSFAFVLDARLRLRETVFDRNESRIEGPRTELIGEAGRGLP